MQVTQQTNGNVQISTKTSPISIGAEVKIGNYSVPGAGEYDVDTIQCEVSNLSNGLVYFIRSEELTVTYLSKLNPEITKLDDASSTNILIVDINSEDKPEQLKPILKALEPSYLLLTGAGATQEFLEELALPKYGNNVLKITRSGLPLEGTFLVA